MLYGIKVLHKLINTAVIQHNFNVAYALNVKTTKFEFKQLYSLLYKLKEQKYNNQMYPHTIIFIQSLTDTKHQCVLVKFYLLPLIGSVNFTTNIQATFN